MTDLTFASEQESAICALTPAATTSKQVISQLLADFIKTERVTIGWVAEQTGLHRLTISRILHGQFRPNPTTCLALAHLMNLPPHEVLTAAGHSATAAILPSTRQTFELPQLDDPELGFYLTELGQMPEKTIQIIKTILREEYEQLLAQQQSGKKSNHTAQRPSFARPLPNTTSAGEEAITSTISTSPQFPPFAQAQQEDN